MCLHTGIPDRSSCARINKDWHQISNTESCIFVDRLLITSFSSVKEKHLRRTPAETESDAAPPQHLPLPLLMHARAPLQALSCGCALLWVSLCARSRILAVVRALLCCVLVLLLRLRARLCSLVLHAHCKRCNRYAMLMHTRGRRSERRRKGIQSS